MKTPLSNQTPPNLSDLSNFMCMYGQMYDDTQVQTQCSNVLLAFLLDYPLGPNRLQHHLAFLVKNLE